MKVDPKCDACGKHLSRLLHVMIDNAVIMEVCHQCADTRIRTSILANMCDEARRYYAELHEECKKITKLRSGTVTTEGMVFTGQASQEVWKIPTDIPED